MTGFVILPADHPPIAIQPATAGGVTITIGNTSTNLTHSEAGQLASATLRTRKRASSASRQVSDAQRQSTTNQGSDA